MGHTGSTPRVTQLSTGTMTTRRPVPPPAGTVSATTSWPGVNGKLVMGSK